MKKEQKLGMIFNELAEGLNITKTMLEKAETAYHALGEYIKGANDQWDAVVYPQGSFQLGTVIKPVNDEEQYDVDLVVLVKSPHYDARALREEVYRILEAHGRYQGKIENKKPCIRIQYSDSSQFHMDIASAQEIRSTFDESIDIARFNGENIYFYEISNPKGYIEWFKRTMKYEKLEKSYRAMMEQAHTEVEELKLSRMRTPLQKAVQILKRHRDIFFANRDDVDDKPSSIIITTLCAMVYEDTYGSFEKDNVYLTVKSMLEKFPEYVRKNSQGEYYLQNPSNIRENFLKKWNSNEKLVTAFKEWIDKARTDIIYNPEQFIEGNPQALRKALYESFGERDSEIALESYGNRLGEYAKEGKMKYDMEKANIVLNEDAGKGYRKHTYFGGQQE